MKTENHELTVRNARFIISPPTQTHYISLMTFDDSQQIKIEVCKIPDIDVNSNDYRVVPYSTDEYSTDVKFYAYCELKDTKAFRINPHQGKWILPPHVSIYTFSWLVAVKKKFEEIKEDNLDVGIWIFARTIEDQKEIGKPFFATYSFTREYIMDLDLDPERFAAKFTVNKD